MESGWVHGGAVGRVGGWVSGVLRHVGAVEDEDGRHGDAMLRELWCCLWLRVTWLRWATVAGGLLIWVEGYVACSVGRRW